jgi:hypothetical protein
MEDQSISGRPRTPTDSFAAIPSEPQHAKNGETTFHNTSEIPIVETVTITKAEYEELLVERERVATLKHIQRVEHYLHKIMRALMKRIEAHDKSKLESPEAEVFALYGRKLKELDYGSESYLENLERLRPALEHHYANNRHHPEHFKNGISDMNLLDIIEMFCDWKASSERQNGGNLRKTLEENGRRFEMDPMLVKILENSLDLLTE